MEEQVQPTPSPSEGRSSASPILLVAVAAAFLVAVVSAVGYAVHERSVANGLATQNAQIEDGLKSTQAQLDALTAKLNALTTPQPAAAPPAVAKHSVQTVARHRRVPKDDPRWKQVQSRLDEQGQQITSTQQDLQSARNELGGSIARTHDELVVLEKRGQRSYFEFDLNKAKQFQPEGPIGMRLKKANTKHEYADLELMVDDLKLQKKHVNVYEPVMFYADNSEQPIELVINSITKNHIHGYVSEPKYKPSDLNAMAASYQNPSANPNTAVTTPPQRQKLDVPKN